MKGRGNRDERDRGNEKGDGAGGGLSDRTESNGLNDVTMETRLQSLTLLRVRGRECGRQPDRRWKKRLRLTTLKNRKETPGKVSERACAFRLRRD